MNRWRNRCGRTLLALGVIAALFLAGRVAWAETDAPSALLSTGASESPSEDYDLTWWTVDGGGGAVSGSGYRLTGTAGQVDAAAPLTGGGYTLYSGFWAGGAIGAGQPHIYLPLVMRN